MSVDEQVIRDLDVLYQSTLDRLATQARDARLIDIALRRILDQDDSSAPTLEWDIERAMSPRTAFRSLALKLVEHMQGSVDREVALSPIDYDDLLVWPIEPRRLGMTATDDFLQRIELARRYRLADFWIELSNRVSPHLSPDDAQRRAGTDLALAFVRELPHDSVIPVFDTEQWRTMSLPIHRDDGEPEWILPNQTVHQMTRTNHALSTLAELGKEGRSAKHIRECTQTMSSSVKKTFRQYEPKQTFHAGGAMRIELTRDTVDYRLTPKLFDLARVAITAHEPTICFLPSHQMNP
jgi:hypothetical protein